MFFDSPAVWKETKQDIYTQSLLQCTASVKQAEWLNVVHIGLYENNLEFFAAVF